MTSDQREAVRDVLEGLLRQYPVSNNSAIDAIAAIMAPQWLPVAELVQDERGVLAGGWDDYGDEFETQFIEANDVCSYPELTHYAELPAALPPKGDDDAKS